MGEGVFAINPGDPGDYQRLLTHLSDAQFVPDCIWHLWSQRGSQKVEAELEAELADGFYSVFYLSQALMTLKLQRRMVLLFIYCSFEKVQPQFAGISGFARALRQENPKLLWKVVEFHNPAAEGRLGLEKRVDWLLAECAKEPNQVETEIRYEPDARLSKTYLEFEPAGNVKPETGLRANGVYLITGGAGGLGLIFARHLAGTLPVKLVLTGRSALNPNLQAHLQDLNGTGSEVVYIQADISNRLEAIKLIAEIKSRFKGLNGVIHSAGVNRDAFVAQKSKAESEAVLAAKVFGTHWLDQLTQDQPLDFFVLFSSLAGVLGNLGQSDYAFANCYLDYFAQERERLRAGGQRQGQTLALNWPLWKDGGMRVERQTEIWLEKKFGLVTLATEDGVGAFTAALHSGKTQLAVILGNREKIRQHFGMGAVVEAVSSGYQQAATAKDEPEQAVTANSPQETETELIQVCSEVMKVRANDLDPEEALSDYGMDSIMMMTMLNRLEAKYDTVIEPNTLVEHNTIRSLALFLINQGIAKRQAAKNFPKNPPPSPEKQEASAGIFKPDYRFRTLYTSPGLSGERKVAIIGAACRFPGSDNLEHFWDNLEHGRHLISEVSPDRWKLTDFYHPDHNVKNKSYSKWGGFLNDIYSFDAAYFGISEVDALMMDPHHRMLLEITEELFCNAGYRRDELSNTKMGVYIGGGESSYVRKNTADLPDDSLKRLIVNIIPNMMAARVSDFYNLKGPSQTIDTACSSSLVAVHQACQAIYNGECGLAVAGGVELLIDPYLHIGFSKAEVLSDDDRSYVFDEKAQGFVLGEGVGAVLLKSFDAAVRDGDCILGVILGSAVNNDGHTPGIIIPSLEGQKDVIREALTRSGVTPDSISYLEAHGTGTLLGDPIEVRAATQVYREFTNERQYCAVGSVKSNLGHLLRAAGVAGLIKVILALQNKGIPPTLNCTKPHPRFGFGESPFYPAATFQKWPERNAPRRAAISSFGFGGTNCHMILEEYPNQQPAVLRRVLPSPRFHRQYYRWGYPIKSGDGYLLNLLENVEQGIMSPQEVTELIESFGL